MWAQLDSRPHGGLVDPENPPIESNTESLAVIQANYIDSNVYLAHHMLQGNNRSQPCVVDGNLLGARLNTP